MTTTTHLRILVTMEEAAKILRIGRTSMYALVMADEVESVHIGRLRRVPVDALEAYVATLRRRRQSESG